MGTSSKKSHTSSTKALRRFGFRQTIRGGLIIGILVGLMMGAQGAAYAAAYPDQASRDALVSSLKSAPALGFLAGEIDDAATPASYSIYKSIALTTLIVAVWGLLTTTRLLRGQEEDGRMEAISAGHITRRAASVQLLLGYGYSLVAAVLVGLVGIAGLGSLPGVNLSVGHALLLTIGVYLPAVFFAGLGVLTNQLAVTRGRATAYALVPLLILFFLRGAANSIADWNWLKHFSPFGWTDLLNPVLAPHPIWILPTLLFSLVSIVAGIYLVGRRDLGASIVPQSDSARSHLYLLKSASAFSLRQNIGNFTWWGFGTLVYAGLLAAIAKLGAQILENSPAFATALGTASNVTHDNLVILFLGFGGTFTALILLVMSTVTMGGIRQEEAKGYADNLLVQPVGRAQWLTSRLLLIIAAATTISLATGYVVWQLASLQRVSLSLWVTLQNAIGLLGAIVLLIGIGAAMYGILPRLAAIVMYIVIVWAFLVDVLKSLFSLDDFVDKTSLLHYVSFMPNKAPDWPTFLWLVGCGVALMTVGVVSFTRRDIVSE